MRHQTPQEEAGKIYEHLRNWTEGGSCQAIVERAGNRVYALGADTRGILMGISNGAIHSGVQRIRDNLLEMIETIELQVNPEGDITGEEISDVLGNLAGTIELASQAGLTLDSNQFAQGRRVSTAHRS